MAESKKDKAVGLAGTIADLAGLATTIGTAVPSLRKAQRRDTSKRAAHAGAQRTAAAAVGASQTGQGATRGLALREGLRAGTQIGVASADAASTAAAQDEARFVAERDARSARLKDFGAGVGQTAAHIGQGIVDLKAMRAAEAQEAGVIEGAGPVLPEEQLEDVGDPQALEIGEGPTLDQTNQYGEPLPGPTADFAAQVQAAPPRNAQEAYAAALGLKRRPILNLAPELEYKLRLENLIVEETDRLGIPTTTVLAEALRRANISADLASMNFGDLYGDSPNYDNGEG